MSLDLLKEEKELLKNSERCRNPDCGHLKDLHGTGCSCCEQGDCYIPSCSCEEYTD